VSDDFDPRDGWEEPFDATPADAAEEAAARAMLEGGEGDPAVAAEVAAALRAAGPSRDLSGDVLGRIRADRVRALPPRPWILRPFPAAAAAAALLLAAVAGIRPALTGRWWWSRETGDRTGLPGTPPSAVPFAFADATDAAGLGGIRHHAPLDRMTWMAESTGSGVAAADLDGDGRPDLVFGDGWSLDADRPAGAGCRLLLNRGDGRFEDATARSGVDVPERVSAVLAADLDNDGLRDLVLAGYGRLRVLRNRGGAVFEDATEASGLPAADGSWYTGAAAADFDRDGVLDLFVTRYADQEEYRRARNLLGTPSGREGTWRGLEVFAGPRPLAPQSDLLLRGLGGFRFRDASAGLEGQEPRYGFQPVATDADGDGWMDVYVANDMQANSLWRNLGGMRFRDEAVEAGCAYDADGKAQAGMGVAVGDAEGDGLPEVLVTNFSNDHLTYSANGGRPGRTQFADRSYPSGIGPASFPFLGWGAVFADFDADGTEDLVTANGHLYPTVAEKPELKVAFAERMQIYQGLGGGSFAERGGEARGLSTPRVHRGLATLDFDGDGLLDCVATTLGGPPVLLRNVRPAAPGRHWIGFRLTGTKSPRDPAGARVSVTAGGITRTRELHLGDSYASTSEPVLRFGLGAATTVDRIVIRWPSGATVEVPRLPVDRIHEITETP
jgi:hypothetical protein